MESRSKKIVGDSLKLSVIVPAYNEEKRIEPMLTQLFEFLNGNLHRGYEIIIVMDGCTDRTASIVSKLAGCHKEIIPLTVSDRLGKGGAIIKAMKHARGEVLAFTDADGSTPPRDLCTLVELTQHYDLVFGSRYNNDSNVPIKESLLRMLLSRGFNVIVKMLFWELKGVNDTQCGAKAFNKAVFEKIRKDIVASDFSFDVNLIYSAKHYNFKVKEVGITWDHVEKWSKFSSRVLKLSLSMLLSIIRLRIYYSRFNKLLDTGPFQRLSRMIMWFAYGNSVA